MPEIILLSLKIYALAIAISVAVAVMIKFIVALVPADKDRAVPAPAPARPSPATGPPQEHVAAIAAAIYASLGAHRIVHIEERDRGHAWTAEGRRAHHASHNVPHHPHR